MAAVVSLILIENSIFFRFFQIAIDLIVLLIVGLAVNHCFLSFLIVFEASESRRLGF